MTEAENFPTIQYIRDKLKRSGFWLLEKDTRVPPGT